MSRGAYLLVAGLLILVASCHEVSAGWFGLSQEELLTKLHAGGGKLSNEKVYEILSRAKDSGVRVDNFSVKELRSLHDLSLESCSAEELNRRHEIAARPLQDAAAHQNVRNYATDDFGTFVIFCAHNADKLFRRYIIAIGMRTRQELSYFKSGVAAAERRLPNKLEAMADYLAHGGEYVNDQYKRTIATGCKSVTEHLSNIVAIQDYAKQLDTKLHLNHSLLEWLQLNESCSLYLEHFAEN